MICNFDKYIPKFFNRDEKFDALVLALDRAFCGIKDDAVGLSTLKDPVRIDARFLNHLGQFLNAGILPFDSERTKRRKIATAVQGHKLRSTWEADAKQVIDSIAGGDATIVELSDSAQWVLFGQEADDPDNYWSTMGTDEVSTGGFIFDSETDFILVEAADTSSSGTIGTDGTDDFGADLMGSTAGVSEGDPNLGIDLIGAGDEIEIPGNIYINVDNKILTDSELDQLEISLEDVTPAYYRIFLGYFNAIGQFVLYRTIG